MTGQQKVSRSQGNRRSWRRIAPSSVQRWGRKAYVGIGQSMPGRQSALPDFILIGGQRCGTTSLFRALDQHPQVIRPTFHKGVNYFDLNYHRGQGWYAAHFPTVPSVYRRANHGEPRMVFEASGYYMYHPFALGRLARDLPRTKVVVMLRDPVERAYSAWKHESARGFDSLDFDAALQKEDQRLSGEIDLMAADPAYESFSHRHHSYRRRGEYLAQLSRAVQALGREQIHVLYSEDFFAQPAAEYAQLCTFLGIAPGVPTVFEQHNARPSRSMPESARRFLASHFSQERTELERLVGRPAPW